MRGGELKGVQEVLASAASDKENSQLSESGLLLGSLHRAVSALSINFNYNDPFNTAGKDSAEYQKMFSDIAESFASLGKELLKMRSTYLPIEMIADVTDGIAQNESNPKNKKISEIIDADITLESYENTFFRLLGMPSVEEIRDRALVTVSNTGKYMSPQNDMGFALTNKVLRDRATPIGDRMGRPTSAAYDFLEGSKPSLERLTDIGFEKVKELSEILAKISDLNKVEKRDEEAAKLASALYGLMTSNKKLADKDSGDQNAQISRLPKFFGPSSNDNESVFLSAKPGYLKYVFDTAFLWLEPRLAPSITPSIKNHVWNEHVLKRSNATMLNLNEPANFWQYSYLLFPPVQDGRIARCISEPSKMVAEPFLPESLRTINGHKLKSTLLEAVIRIRLDIVSGFPQKTASVSRSGLSSAGEGDSRPITPDEMGLLESLLVTRLFSALHGMARDAKEKIKVMQSNQANTGVSPSSTAAQQESDQAQTATENKVKSPKQVELESIILVEESLMLLFGDGSTPGALSMQEGVARNSGVKSAHLMSAALSILNIPKKWAEMQLGDINEVNNRSAEKGGQDGAQAPRAVLGVAKGVGAVDILAYLLALFTAGEEVLLALLNDRQFQYLKDEYPKGYFDNFRRNEITTGYAVSEIADRAFDAYQLFRYMLSAPNHVFRYPEIAAINTEGPGSGVENIA